MLRLATTLATLLALAARLVAHGVGRLSAFATGSRGVAAVEFALLLPVLVVLYAGAGELSQAFMTSRKVEALSRTLADLASRQPTSLQLLSTPAPANATTSATLQTILNASLPIMAPGPYTPLKMTVSAIDITNNVAGLCCVFKVRWSYTQGGTLRPCSTYLTPVSPTQAPSPGTVSNAMLPPVASLSSPIPMLIADVSYVYQAPFSTSWLNLSTTMTRTSYMLPRTTGQVIVASPISPGAGQSGTVCY